MSKGLTLSGSLAVAGAALSSDAYVTIPASTTSQSHIKYIQGVAPTSAICGQVFYDGMHGADLCGGVRTYNMSCMWNKASMTTVTAWNAVPSLPFEVTIIDGAGIGSRTLTPGLMRVSTIFRVKFKGIITTLNASSSARMSVVTTTGGVDSEIYGQLILLPKLTASVADIDMDLRINTQTSGPILGTMTVIGSATTGGSSRTIFGTGNLDTSVSQTLDIRYCFDSAGHTLDCHTATIQILY